MNCWWKSSAFLCSSELVYLFNQQLCALGCLYPVKLGLCFHISIREGLHCNSAWSFHSTCSYAYFFICVRPDHHIATELLQFMPGEGPCKCYVLQSAAKITLWLINCSQISMINTITFRWGCEEKDGETILTTPLLGGHMLAHVCFFLCLVALFGVSTYPWNLVFVMAENWIGSVKRFTAYSALLPCCIFQKL